jgi:hypothetical protein
MQLHPSKIYRLAHFEEAAGILHEIMEQDGVLEVRIGQILLALPMSLKQVLRPLIGQRIAVLRTDIPQKQYLFRVIDLESNYSARASNSMDRLLREKIGSGVAAPESISDKANYYGI